MTHSHLAAYRKFILQMPCRFGMHDPCCGEIVAAWARGPLIPLCRKHYKQCHEKTGPFGTMSHSGFLDWRYGHSYWMNLKWTEFNEL